MEENSSERSRMLPKERVEETGVKIYPFSIDKLNEDNAGYWFRAMERSI